MGAVIASLKVHMPLTDERHDDLQCLLKAVDAMVETVAKHLILSRVPTCAKSEDEPAPTNLIQAFRHSCKECWPAKRHTSNHGPQQDSGRGCGKRTEEGERLPPSDICFVRRIEQEMVGKPERVEARILGAAYQSLQIGEPGSPATESSLGLIPHNANPEHIHLGKK